MRINTNVAALNTLRQVGKADAGLARSIGRLSSGFRINRAADDAAGLGIANQLRADIRALKQAGRNAEQANSLLQVAEGAAQTIQSIAERMKELATQAASDNVSDTDRALINAEFTELKGEIDRVIATTEFQGSALVDGTLGNAVDELDAAHTMDDIAAVQSISISGTKAGTYNVSQTTTTVTMSFDGKTEALSGLSAGQQNLSFDLFGVTLEMDSTFNVGAGTETFATAKDIVVAGGNTEFVVSVSGDPSGNDRVLLGSMDLTRTTLTVTGSLDTKANAVTAMGQIDIAIGKVSEVFGTIGAAQNRIDFAAANTQSTVENFSAAESVIRDVDMAAEVTEMTKFQILQQAGTAVLAQANAAPQGVLRLLS
jgi:flagellin